MTPDGRNREAPEVDAALGRPWAAAPRTRIVVLGGGVGGLAAARDLDRRFARRSDVEVTLVSRDNFFLLSPLLFEACSGVLELRHCAQPIRPCLRRARFIEATVEHIDVERRVVHVVSAEGALRELGYDHVVIALGATTNLNLVTGSEHARTFKTVADALLLRNHVIERLERADVETDPRRRQQLLTAVVIGGGLVGVELLGELTAFVYDQLRYYPRIRREELRFHLFEAGGRLLPESTPFVARYAEEVLRRRGAEVRTSTPVQAIEPGVVRWKDGSIEADTIVLAAGVVPSAVAAAAEVERDRRGRIVTDATMRSVSHPNVWAIGDCAAIPGPDGKPYPALAQHAVREARGVARNLRAVVGGRAPKPFVYRTLGTMAAFGHTRRGRRARARAEGLHRLVDAANVLPVPDAAVGHASTHRPRLDGVARLPSGADESRPGAGARAGTSQLSGGRVAVTRRGGAGGERRREHPRLFQGVVAPGWSPTTTGSSPSPTRRWCR